MKNYKKLIAVFLCLSIVPNLFAQKVVGYIPGSYRDISQMDVAIEWEKMTDYYYFGSYPTGAGDIVLESKETPGVAGLDYVISKAALHGKNVWLSVGGWGKSGNFITVARTPSALTAFCNKALQLCRDYNLTGIDIDWEFPSYGQEEDFRDFFKALYEKLNPEGYLVSAAAGGEASHADKWLDATFDYIDDLNIMSYDAPAAYGNHASLDFMKDAMDLYYAQGCPWEKMLGGVAFYSRGTGVLMYRDILNGVGSSDKQSTYENDAVSGYQYNGRITIEKKIDYVMDKGGLGILIWEVTQDTLGQYSLLNACDSLMEKHRCGAPTPNLGDDQSICGLSSITLDGGVPQQAGVTFTWKNGSTTLVDKSATANTYDISAAGTYTLEVWQDGCERSDEITISGVLSTPDLGGPYDLCDPISVELDAGVSAGGRTIEWQLNDVTIAGETASTITANKNGTYKVIVSATGCSSVNASAVVNSELPTADNDTICEAGDATDLTASEAVKWYASDVSEPELATGTVYSPIVSANTTFWMGSTGEAATQYTTLNSSFSSDVWAANQNVYANKLIIEQEIAIDAVTVNASNGSVTINLVASDGTTVVKTKTFPSVSGLQELDLSWTGVAAGTYYLNAVGSAVQLFVDPNEASSDFNVSGVITVERLAYEDWTAPYGDAYVLSTNLGNFHSLKVTAGTACARVPVQVVIDASNPGCLSVGSEEAIFSEMKLYPNPTNAEFTISGVEGDIQIYDLKGSVVEEYNSVSGMFNFGSNLDRGVYFVQVNINGQKTTQKVVKK